MPKPNLPPEEPESLPLTVPHELFPTTNIRHVITELAKVMERVDNLSRAVDKQGAALEAQSEKHAALFEKQGVAFATSLEKQTDRLVAEFKEKVTDLGTSQKERHEELKTAHKETRDKVSKIEGNVSFVKGAAWVFGGLFVILVALLAAFAKYVFDKI